ncbi:MAG: 5'-3' exonuclease H3TH domain-containing protein [Candidatus Gracilibacteria bacterium]|nr:5'-3' exonuclease H3TH domain-containing protein [Candidatus Gracilibacteria bacterium]
MKKIYIIDGNSFIYRMFYALPEFSTSDGKLVNAIFGMAKFFVNLSLKDKPDYLIFVRDAKGDNFRHEIYADYKATRDRMPDNLKVQLSSIDEMIGKMGIEIIEIPGFEADDVIATLAVDLGKNPENDIYILSGDKDLFSLITENVKMYDTMKKKIYGPDDTIEKFGVKPEYISDYLAIVGDTSDNIPGIPGFGPKKAIELISLYGSVEGIYENLDKITGKTKETLDAKRDLAELSKKLATIDRQVNLGNFALESNNFLTKNILNDEIKEYFRAHEFFSLIGEENVNLKKWEDLNLKVKIIGDKQGLDELKNKITNYKEIVFDTETTNLNTLIAEIVGVSIYLDDANIYYINHAHRGPQVSFTELKEFLDDIFNMDITIIGHNIKYDLEVIESYFKSSGKTEVKKEELSQTSLFG